MKRIYLSKEELQVELNSRLHNARGNSDISFGGTTLLAEVDSDGSNWSKAIFMQGQKEDVVAYTTTIEAIIIDVRSKYNLIGN